MLDTDTLVVGASAAGLATAAQLQGVGSAFEIVEADDAVAAQWRRHYDRLHLHTPRTSSALPGLPMPRSWGRYPSRDQVVGYLERYQRHFGLRPHFGQAATRIERVDGGWETTTSTGSCRSRNVVVATGRTRVPVRPTWSGMDRFQGDVLHSGEYRNGDPWRGLPVLVVGFGNSACEQALDLVERGAKVHLSVRSPVNVVPRDLFGVVPVLQLGIVMRRLPVNVADALAAPLIRLTVGDVQEVGLRKLPYGPNTQIARDGHIPLLDIGTMEKIRAGLITVHGDIDHFTDDGVVLSDGSSVAVAAVVLATGYRAAVDDFLQDWEAVCDPSGTPLRSGGPSGLDGLYFCGMYVSPAGMLREIGIEARRIAAHIAGRRPVAAG
ncbi:MAG: flavin-containing monooxygenase [Actinomycetes bacterium]